MTNSLIYSNGPGEGSYTAQWGMHGGGIGCDAGTLKLHSNTFFDNVARRTSQYGKAACALDVTVRSGTAAGERIRTLPCCFPLISL